MQKSSNNETITKKKKHLNSSFDHTINIFSEEYHNSASPYQKIKKDVRKNLFDKSYAGIKTNYETSELRVQDKISTDFMNYIKKSE